MKLRVKVPLFVATCKIQGCYLIRAYELDFSRNNITGIIDPRLFPDGSAANKTGLVSLKNFLLQTTGLGGRIPEEIGNCKFLSLLALDENRFYGPIPSSLVAGNLLGGKIPDEVVLLNHLRVIDLSSNQISGELPAQLGKLSNLLVLNLKDNMLSGQVPVGIEGLSSLENLDLSSNMLSGPIPYQIGECSKLRFLSLGMNSFKGTIPYQIGNLVGLHDLLDLSYNLLSGGIPSQLAKLTSLSQLNLSHNNLSGSIPASLSNMLSLVSVNFSHNNLEGPLPDTSIFHLVDPDSYSNNKDLCGEVQGLRRCTTGANEKDGDATDPRLSPPAERKAVDLLSRVITLARSCTRVDPRSRPTMRTVSQLLEMKAAGSE
ncbi:hypothetical protein DKX38_004408 [Salix brachista]|uniref:Serine-threonine/tyrosine-protein kinase catalytic domain-containing protein n=1 Tax=Salix brachista TaxID=2182728 RepID=A0A5N5NA29_9ROSI|nr:hypothetical protein DKX38_004408 [Salix brachista]